MERQSMNVLSSLGAKVSPHLEIHMFFDVRNYMHTLMIDTTNFAVSANFVIST
jgi:hypothetical protein